MECPHCNNNITHFPDCWEHWEFQHEIRGHRLFKFNLYSKETFQIVLNSGKSKKGRPNNFGVTSLAYNSFIGNFPMKLYEKNFKKVDSERWNQAINEAMGKIKS